MKILLRQHKDDADMVEIIQETNKGLIVYGVVHVDFIIGDFAINNEMTDIGSAHVEIKLVTP